MDKQAYISNKAWQDNPYLIIPPNTSESLAGSAHKKCRCCQEVKFTSEYIDHVSFEDKKLPVCNTCVKLHDGSGRVFVSQYAIMQKCKKCKQEKNLAEFAVNTSKNIVSTICLFCTRERLQN